MKIDQLIEYEMSVNFHKIQMQKLKTDIRYTINSNLHSYNTRTAQSFHLGKLNNNWGANSFENRGKKIYNKINASMKEIKSIYTFKNLMKKKILKEQERIN